jgi:ABC-2 type transport system ATP-binding protein
MEEAERLCDRVAILERGRIVDVDTPAGLVRRHCPERTIVLTTDDPQAEQRFRALPQVEAVTREDARLVVSGSGDDLIAAVIQSLGENRTRVTEFRTLVPNLEDVFLKLTGRSIRD